MKILVYGAGVIGTLYALRLEEAGHEVTVLARGNRLKEIEEHGLIVEDVTTGVRSSVRVACVSELDPEDSYDLALITVRNENLPALLPVLAANGRVLNFLFMLNNPQGSPPLVHAVGLDRVLLGFPGAGGALKDHVVHYALISQQPTTIGEPRGLHTARLKALIKTMRAAGFAARIDNDMDGWLACHAFFVTSVCAAIYLAGDDCASLSSSSSVLDLMIDGVREGFRAVRALGHAVHPLPLRILFLTLPRPAAVHYWRRYFAQPLAEFVFAQHARNAVTEMRSLQRQCCQLLAEAGVESPALEKLYAAIDNLAPVS